MDLKDLVGKGASAASALRMKFCNVKPASSAGGTGSAGGATVKLHESLGWDGLPLPGSWVNPGDPLYCVVDELTGKVTVGKVSWRLWVRKSTKRRTSVFFG